MTADVLVLAGPQTLPRVNLLPPEIHLARKARRIKGALVGVVVFAAAIVGVLTMMAHHSVSSAKSKLDAANARHAALQRQVTALGDVTALRQQVAAAKGMLAAAMGNEVLWSHYLNDLSLRIPDNVWLTNMSVTMSGASSSSSTTSSQGTTSVLPGGMGQISFTGKAFSHDDVATWLDSLAKENCYANPYFSNSTATTIGDRPAVDFTSTVTITSGCLSGRYTSGS